ncbi:MAG: hypothetical protein NVSMB57_03460 [Actinomycetota bacterium]
MGAFAGGGVISLGSMVGFFTVFGVAARNGIMMFNHFEHLERFLLNLFVIPCLYLDTAVDGSLVRLLLRLDRARSKGPR